MYVFPSKFNIYRKDGNTVNKLGLKVTLRVTRISLASRVPEGGVGSKCRVSSFLPSLDFFAAGDIRVSQTHLVMKNMTRATLGFVIATLLIILI